MSSPLPQIPTLPPTQVVPSGLRFDIDIDIDIGVDTGIGVDIGISVNIGIDIGIGIDIDIGIDFNIGLILVLVLVLVLILVLILILKLMLILIFGFPGGSKPTQQEMCRRRIRGFNRQILLLKDKVKVLFLVSCCLVLWGCQVLQQWHEGLSSTAASRCT